METKGKNVVSLIMVINMVILIGALMGAQRVNGQGPIICGIPAQKFMGCLPALKGPSPQPPTQACCATIKGCDEKCLCGYSTSPLLPTYGIDSKNFLAIFGKCGLPNCP